MFIPLSSLILLVATIAIGYFKKTNTGLIGLASALLFGVLVVGLTGKEIVAGFPTNVFMTLSGMMLLFAIARLNGTLDMVAMKIISMAGTNVKLLPIVFFVLSAILSFIGPGPVVMTAIIVPVAMSVAKQQKIKDLLMGLSVIFGSLAGGLYKITSSGYIAYSLGVEAGIINYTPIFLATFCTSLLAFLFFYFLLGGFKLEKIEIKNEVEQKKKLTSSQILTLIVLVATILLITIAKWDIGLSAYLGAAILFVCNIADDGEAIKLVNWSTILLVCGMGILVNVISEAGGIALLSDGLSKIMTEKTATMFMVLIAGLMSSVSSASGVVMPTLIPTIPGIVANMGGDIDPSVLLMGIIIGSHIVTASPLSTLGAMTLASSNEYTDKNKMFNQLLIIGFGGMVVVGILAYLGFYNLFN